MNAPHDPGGKVRLRLDDSIAGDAMFAGTNDCYRLWLSRKWYRLKIYESRIPNNFALWIGLNPSTADASVNDPTINREIDFSMKWGFDGLVKVNVCDYRSTKPEGLLEPGVEPCSRSNLAVIRDLAKHAETIICAWGAVHPRLSHHAVAVESALRADGRGLFCLGTNKGGTPKHPLYVHGDTPLIPFLQVPI